MYIVRGENMTTVLSELLFALAYWLFYLRETTVFRISLTE
jgi:hypothetical protein